MTRSGVDAGVSLMPSSHCTADSLGPPGRFTVLPPIPWFTTLTRSPCAACSRRDRSLLHRSLPLIVDAVPSVIESPKAQTTTVSAAAITSTALRKYHDVLVYG